MGRHWRALACEAGKLGSGLEEQAGAAWDRLVEGPLGRRGALTPSRSSRTQAEPGLNLVVLESFAFA